MIVEISKIIGQTLKKPPSKEYIESFKMLIRGGFLKVMNDNSFVYTPILNKSIDKLSNIILQHLQGFNIISFFPHFSSDSVTEFLDSEINSYKQLPQAIMYQMRQSNILHFLKSGLLYPQTSQKIGFIQILNNKDEMAKASPMLEKKILSIFDSLGLKLEKYYSTEDIDHTITNSVSYDFSFLSELGKQEYVICSNCDYKADRNVATIYKNVIGDDIEKGLSEVETPESSTIAHIADFLGVPESKCAKAVFYSFESQHGVKVALVIIRGDMEVNEFKIRQLLVTDTLKVATNEEIEMVGCVPGFASAIGVNKELCTVIVDDLIPKSKNLVAGANKIDYHLLNTNYKRDYTGDIVSDIAYGTDESLCSNCQSLLKIQLGLPLCHITENLENSFVSYLNEKGKPMNVSTINFHFDLTRIIGILALNHDKFGINFPIQICPFQIALITIGSDPEVRELGDKLHEELEEYFDILYDNRDVKLGVKLIDTDLRSIPFRLIISKNSLENDQIEFSKRGSKDKRYFKLEKVLTEIEKMKEIISNRIL
ncbi:MAG: hypothetical protein GPJ54_03275 [Candidatus Heimdallarchaeota archaeon]|nr:hypothetical protein [Candidatus Heimdallarchaeota archaeon]